MSNIDGPFIVKKQLHRTFTLYLQIFHNSLDIPCVTALNSAPALDQATTLCYVILNFCFADSF
jgi:hypothetical protein